MTTRTASNTPTRTRTRRLARSVAAVWADCDYASRRLVELQTQVGRNHR